MANFENQSLEGLAGIVDAYTEVSDFIKDQPIDFSDLITELEGTQFEEDTSDSFLKSGHFRRLEDGEIYFATESGFFSFHNKNGVTKVAIFRGSTMDAYVRGDYIPAIKIKISNNDEKSISMQVPIVLDAENEISGVQLVETPKILTRANPILVHLTYPDAVIGQENILIQGSDGQISIVRSYKTVDSEGNTVSRREIISSDLQTTERRKATPEYIFKKLMGSDKSVQHDIVFDANYSPTSTVLRIISKGKTELDLKMELMKDFERNTMTFGDCRLVVKKDKPIEFNYFELFAKGLIQVESDNSYNGATKHTIPIPNSRNKLVLIIDPTGRVVSADIN